MARNIDMARGVLSSVGQMETQRRIEEQQALVDSLEPGSAQHERATKVLLLMRDALHVLTGLDAVIGQALKAAE